MCFLVASKHSLNDLKMATTLRKDIEVAGRYSIDFQLKTDSGFSCMYLLGKKLEILCFSDLF